MVVLWMEACTDMNKCEYVLGNVDLSGRFTTVVLFYEGLKPYS